MGRHHRDGSQVRADENSNRFVQNVRVRSSDKLLRQIRELQDENARDARYIRDMQGDDDEDDGDEDSGSDLSYDLSDDDDEDY